jgi:hypothetical protein
MRIPTALLAISLLSLHVARDVRAAIPLSSHAVLDSSNLIRVVIGHGYLGSESFATIGDRIIHTFRDVGAGGEVNERRTILIPNAGVWNRFWLRIDRANVWQWDFRYSELSHGQQMDGSRWHLALHHGTQRVESVGYNSAPKNFDDFQGALDELVAESAVDSSNP